MNQRADKFPVDVSVFRRADRVAAAMGALLLQLAFIAAFLHAFSSQAPPKQLGRELTFFLPRLLPKPVPAAPVTPSRAPSVPISLPAILPPLLSLRLAPPVTNAPPAGLANFGRALFGCAPENWTSLTPQQRALCPPPGAGMAIQSAPSQGLPSQVKDNPHWANAMAHEQSPVLLPGANPDHFGITLYASKGPSLLGSILSGSIADPESWPTYIDPKQFMPPPPFKVTDESDIPARAAGDDPK